MIHLGFQASFADSLLFIFQSKSTIIYLLLYVDDIIITGNNSQHVSSLIAALSSVFELKGLGDLNYFLGVQISRTQFGLTLSQSKYASEVLHRFHIENSKPTKNLYCLPHACFLMMVLPFLILQSFTAWLVIFST